MKSKVLLFFLLTVTFSLYGQNKQHKVICIAFYNLENLFDVVDDTTHWDDQFTPQGDYLYTETIYKEKLNNLSTVISQIGLELTPDGPAIIGVSEIENRSVLEDLVAQESLKDRNYQIIHYDSRDFRGIDVGFLYNPKYFEPIFSLHIPLITKTEGIDTSFSRDVLFVVGTMDGEKVLLSVNHWPSRRGGEKATSHLRNKAAIMNKTIIDSLSLVHGIEKIIIMGDMNDDPNNESMKSHLLAKGKKEKVKKGEMYNPMWKYYKKGYGTTAWNDAWSLFDQVVVSYPFINDSEGFTFYQAKVFSKRWLAQKTGQYKGYPFRTYAGGQYRGGYSDHFPVYLFLVKEIQSGK